MKRYLPFALIVLVALVAASTGGLLYRAKRAELETKAADVSNASLGARSPHLRGQANAPVTLEEFGDFQCPPCADLWFVLARLEQEYGVKLGVLFREYPLQMHAQADLAARAAEAAGLQNRFWEMHDLLYRNQAIWSKAGTAEAIFNKYAFSTGLEVERFKRDLESKEVRERILADQERASSLGVKSTPSVFINGHMLPPAALNQAGLRTAIEDELNGKATTPIAAGRSTTP